MLTKEEYKPKVGDYILLSELDTEEKHNFARSKMTLANTDDHDKGCYKNRYFEFALINELGVYIINGGGLGGINKVTLKDLGWLDDSDETDVEDSEESKGSLKSDGGSSDYYKVIIPEWVLDKQNKQGYIMLEDLAEVLFNNEFNYTNIFKAQKRMFSLEQGAGKLGNSFEYDAKKCKYYVDKQVEVFSR